MSQYKLVRLEAMASGGYIPQQVVNRMLNISSGTRWPETVKKQRLGYEVWLNFDSFREHRKLEADLLGIPLTAIAALAWANERGFVKVAS